GQKVRFGMRSVNKRGSIILVDVTPISEMLRMGMRSPNAEEFVRDGNVICATLAEAVHTGVDPGPLVERETRGFMAFARQNFIFGAWKLPPGMNEDDAANAIRSGEYDPFEHVSMPRMPYWAT